MSKHTAGPWRIDRGAIQDGEGHAIIDGTDMGQLSRIAHVLFHDDGEGETTANARLIAAAPDMLEALQKIASSAPSHIAYMAWAAIEKATGEKE